MSAYYETITVPADQIQLVFGQFDRNIKNLEKAYHVGWFYGMISCVSQARRAA